MLAGIVALLAPRAQAARLKLTLNAAAGTPDLLVGDAGRLRQIIINLTGNALKFTAAGEVVIEVQPATEPGLLHFSVRDTGIGIPQEKHADIFEAFSQADSSITRRYGGTGLGLTICSRLVKAMDGRIWVESIPGEGSSFHFTARFGLQNSAPADLLGDVPILVIGGGLTLGPPLAAWGMKPVFAADASQALQFFEEAFGAGTPFPLALLDRDLPGAVELPAQIHARDERTRIIVLTAPCSYCDPASCQAPGVAALLAKPPDEAGLLKVIVNLLNGDSPQRTTCDQPIPSLAILLVEDTPVNQKVARRLLEKKGHAVTVANNGREALQALERDRFDLALMDVQMPVMDGLETTAAIRKQEQSSSRRMPIIAMTAHALNGDLEKCLQAGMDGYVSKPFHPRKLFEEIYKIMQRNPSGDTSRELQTLAEILARQNAVPQQR